MQTRICWETGRSTFDKEHFKCQYCNLERKYSNGGRSSLIQHSHFKIMNTLRNLALLLLRWSARTTLLSCRKLPGCWLKLISRARKSNAAYKEDLRKAAEEEKERTSPRGWQLERGRRKAAVVNTEKWERARWDLQEKINAKKNFFEEQNNIQKKALAKGERMKSADALRQNLPCVPRFGE